MKIHIFFRLPYSFDYYSFIWLLITHMNIYWEYEYTHAFVFNIYKIQYQVKLTIVGHCFNKNAYGKTQNHTQFLAFLSKRLTLTTYHILDALYSVVHNFDNGVHSCTQLLETMHTSVRNHGNMCQGSWTQVSETMDTCVRGHGHMCQKPWIQVSKNVDTGVRNHGYRCQSHGHKCHKPWIQVSKSWRQVS